MGALSNFFKQPLDEPELFNDDMFNGLIEDFYNFEAIMGQVAFSIDRTLPANFSTSSLTFVSVTGSSYVHNFTKANALIRVSNISGSMSSGTTQTIFAKPSITGVGEQTAFLYSNLGTTGRQGSTAAVYSGLTAGNKTVELVAAVTGGTGVISSGMRLGIEIMEWD